MSPLSVLLWMGLPEGWRELRPRIPRKGLADEWLTARLKGDGFFEFGQEDLELPVILRAVGFPELTISRLQAVSIFRNGAPIFRGFVQEIDGEFESSCTLTLRAYHMALTDTPAGEEVTLPGAGDPVEEWQFDTGRIFGNESGYLGLEDYVRGLLDGAASKYPEGPLAVSYSVTVPEDPLAWGGDWIPGALFPMGSFMATSGGLPFTTEGQVASWRTVAGEAALVAVVGAWNTDIGFIHRARTYRPSGGLLVLEGEENLWPYAGLPGPLRGLTADELDLALVAFGPLVPDAEEIGTDPVMQPGIWGGVHTQLGDIIQRAGGNPVPGTEHQIFTPAGWVFVSWVEAGGPWWSVKVLPLSRNNSLRALYRGAKVATVLRDVAVAANRLLVWGLDSWGHTTLELTPRASVPLEALEGVQILSRRTTRRKVTVEPRFAVNTADLLGSGLVLSDRAVAQVGKYYRETYSGEVLDHELVLLDPLGLIQLGRSYTLNGDLVGIVYSLGENVLDGRRKVKATAEALV